MTFVRDFLLIFMMSVCASSCARHSTVVDSKKGKPTKNPACVAVVPFENRTSNSNAAEVMTLLISEAGINLSRFRVMESGSVTAFLDHQGVRIASVVDAQFASTLGKLLGVDAVLMGSVDEYAYRDAGGRSISEPTVSISGKLVDTESAEVIWNGSVRRTTDSAFSSGRDPLTRVALLAAKDMMSTLPKAVTEDEALEPCGRLKADLDIDSDGVLNLADRCPYQTELFNGIDDEDGCPEDGLAVGDLRRLVEIQNGRLLYQGEIRFLEGTDTLYPHSILLLRAMAIFLNKESVRIPRLQVEGFSNEEGSKRYRELFSFSRAEAVKQVLIKNGVDPSRLAAVGYDAQSKARPVTDKVIEFLILE